MSSVTEAPPVQQRVIEDPPARKQARRPLARSHLGEALLGSIGLIAFFGLWELAPRVGLVDRTFLPPLSTVLEAWEKLAANGQLWSNTSASLHRSIVGFALAVLIAVPLGVTIGWYRPVARALGPLLELFRNTAALALLPVFTLVLGIGETAKIALVIYACVWPILLNTVSAVQSVDPLLVKSARSLGLSPLRILAKVVLPASVPTIFTGIRLAGAFSILILIAAEMVGAKAGLGYLINYSQFNFQIADMYAGILTISILGLAVNAGLVALERRLTRWRSPAR